MADGNDAWFAVDLRDVTGKQQDGKRMLRLDTAKIYKAATVPVSNRRWRVEQMIRSRTLYPAQGILNEQCEPLTVRELTTGAVEWLQLLIDQLPGFVIRVVLNERVAYLEEQITSPEGEHIALSRVEEWELCEDQPAFDDVNADGNEARLYTIHRLQAKDLLQPSPRGKAFLDALMICRSVKGMDKEDYNSMMGADQDDLASARTLLAIGDGSEGAAGEDWRYGRNRKPGVEGPDAKRARPTLNLSTPKGEDDGDDVAGGRYTGLLSGRGRGRGRGRGSGRGLGGRFSAMRAVRASSMGGDEDFDVPVTARAGSGVVQSHNQHCQVVMAPDDHVGQTIAPALGRLVNHLVEGAMTGAPGAFNDLLRLCRVLPVGLAAARQAAAASDAEELAGMLGAAGGGHGEGEEGAHGEGEGAQGQPAEEGAGASGEHDKEHPAENGNVTAAAAAPPAEGAAAAPAKTPAATPLPVPSFPAAAPAMGGASVPAAAPAGVAAPAVVQSDDGLSLDGAGAVLTDPAVYMAL